MPESTVKKQLNRAKQAACQTLNKAGYKIERASNDIYCVVAMRDVEWRAIKIGTEQLQACLWFKKEVKRLERLPCPDSTKIKKEVWIRSQNERGFCQYSWNGLQWINEDGESALALNN